MHGQRGRVISAIVFISLVGVGLVSDACSERQGFYSKNQARTPFAPKPHISASPEIEYFLPVRKFEENQANEFDRSGSNDSRQAPVIAKTRDELLSYYGDPTAEVPILGREDAPKPFKAMMQAMEIGDEELARGYAKQFVGYINKVQSRNASVMNFVGDALNQRGEQNSNARLKALLQDENDTPDAIEPSQNPTKLMVDPKGEVDALIVLRLGDLESQKMIPVIQRLNDYSTKDPRVQAHVFFVGAESREQLAEYAAINGLRIEPRDGTILANELNLKKLPATVLVSRNTGQHLIRQEVVEFNELLSVVNKIQGERND